MSIADWLSGLGVDQRGPIERAVADEWEPAQGGFGLAGAGDGFVD